MGNQAWGLPVMRLEVAVRGPPFLIVILILILIVLVLLNLFPRSVGRVDHDQQKD